MKTQKRYSKEELNKILKEFGYKEESIKSLLLGRMDPLYSKAKLLHKKYRTGFIWGSDIKSYLKDIEED